MTLVDYQARLTKVSAAIDAILTGGNSSYEIDGLSVTKLDLDKLQQEEARLIARINRQDRRGGGVRTVVPL